jgi:dTDP-glucose pyrophosphorylase
MTQATETGAVWKGLAQAVLIGYPTHPTTSPEPFAVVTLDSQGQVLSLAEKPEVAGSLYAILEAGQLVQRVAQRRGLKIARLEDIAFRKGWPSHADLERAAQQLHQTASGRYLHLVAEGDP